MEQLNFLKLVQQGNHYAIGYERGAAIANIVPLVQLMTTIPEGLHEPNQQEEAEQLDYLNQWCPGMKEELAGFAEGMGVSISKLLHCYVLMPPKGAIRENYVSEHPRGCSQISVQPSKSDNHHSLMARNYEYTNDDELIFSVTRCEHELTHAGFSLMQLGRFDGMNEKGLAVTMSTCEFLQSSAGEGFGVHFYVAIRHVLDQCTSTKEALDYLCQVPICNNINIMVSDGTGDSAVVEVLNVKGESRKAIRRGDGYLYSVNHYQSEEHTALCPKNQYFSSVRSNRLDKFFADHEKVSLDDLKQLLTDKIPEGLCCHAYHNWFGTLRSMLFDLTEQRMWVVYGSPQTGTWFEVDMKEACKAVSYSIPYTDEAPAEGFFEYVD